MLTESFVSATMRASLGLCASACAVRSFVRVSVGTAVVRESWSAAGSSSEGLGGLRGVCGGITATWERVMAMVVWDGGRGERIVDGKEVLRLRRCG